MTPPPPSTFNLKIPVPTASGHVITYNVVLDGQGPLVILSHALMADLRMWDSTVLALTHAGYRTLRWDYIGHGSTSTRVPLSQRRRRGSELAEIPFLFDEFTKHMREIVLRATGVERAHAVVGCSMGGVLALRFAMLYPGCAGRVVSCDAPGGVVALAAARELWKQRVEEFAERGVEELAAKTVDRWFPGDGTKEVKEMALAQTRACTFEGFSACADAIQQYDYRADVGRIRAKTMVLVGGEDASIGDLDVLRGLAEKIKHAQYVKIEGCGHIPPMHKPQEFEAILLEFLGKKEKS